LEARLTVLLCKKRSLAKSKKVKTGSNLAEFSKKGYGSKGLFPSDDEDEEYLTKYKETNCWL
jgi:hypothetical protein